MSDLHREKTALVTQEYSRRLTKTAPRARPTCHWTRAGAQALGVAA